MKERERVEDLVDFFLGNKTEGKKKVK